MKIFYVLIFFISFSRIDAQYFSKYQIDSIMNMRKQKDEMELKNKIKIVINESNQKNQNELLFTIANPKYYDIINSYSMELAPVLMKYYKINYQSRFVLGLLNLNNQIKDSILSFKYTEDFIRARLGDTNAEHRILAQYNNQIIMGITDKIELNKLNEYTYNILYVSSRKTINSFIRNLESSSTFVDYSSFCDPPNRNSIFYNHILLFNKFHPRITLFDYLYYSSFLYSSESDAGYTKYKNDVEQFFKTNYDIRIIIKAPYLIKGQECYDIYYNNK